MSFRSWFKNRFNKWRLLLLVFIVIYASLLSLNLGYMSIQWDEISHLYGGLLIARGQSQEYVASYGYYPPLYDILTTGYFNLFGVSAASGRLAAVTFSLLSIWIVFEFVNRTYGPKIALISSILLGTMPGFFWVSRVAMLETMLIFFFSLAMFFFLSWMRSSQKKPLILCGLALGVGFLAKYQVLVAGLVMIVVILFLSRDKLRARFSKFPVLAIIAILVVIPWVLILYEINGLGKFGELLYVIQEGGQDRAVYSARFGPYATPIFYLIEMTWPFPDIPVHPISLPIYILGLVGLGLWACRRKTEDKFFLIWFITIYVFFTLIPNKQWRYVTPLFPVLAISAASFTMFLYSKIKAWEPSQIGLIVNRFKKFAAAVMFLYSRVSAWKPKLTGLIENCFKKFPVAFFIVLAASAIVYSSYNAYQMTARDQIHLPIDEAANYLASHLDQSQSAVIVCASNLLDQDMFRFYLPAHMSKEQIWQYPDLAVDAFTPNFNITEFVGLCQQRNVKYIILFDYGPHMQFFNTTLDYTQVKTMIYKTGRFDDPTDRPFFGEFSNNKGYRLFLVRFNG